MAQQAAEGSAPKRRRWPWVLAGLLVLGGLGLGLWRPWQKAPVAFPVARQDLREIVEVSGSVEAAQAVGLKAEGSGVVEALTLPENGRALEGQLLLRLRPGQARLQLQQAKANAEATLASTRTQLASAQASWTEVSQRQRLQGQSLGRRLEKARLQVAHLERELARVEALAREGGVSDQSLATQRQSLAQAQQDLGLAQDELRRWEGGTELVQARNALAQAHTAWRNAQSQGRAAVALAQKAVDDTELRAPFGGTLTDWLVEPGQWVSPGTPLAQFQDLDHLRLRLPVDELDLPKLKVGTSVEITFDAYPERPLPGRVSRISQASVLGSSNVQVFPVEVSFQDPEGRIRPGMSADANMLVRELKGVLALPLGAVTRRIERFYVQVLEGGKLQEREVSPGVSTLEAVEIRSGLKEGEQVVLPAGLPSPSPKPSASP